MSNQELVHEIDSERESNIQILKAKLNNLGKHSGSKLTINADTQELATQLASNLDSDTTPSASVVSDEVLVKSNTVPFIYANDRIPNNYGDQFVNENNRSMYMQDENTPHSERSYQIKLLSAPKRDRLYVSEVEETRNTEVITMMLLVLLVVIIAIILHLIVNEAETSVHPNDQDVYLLMAHANNRDPVLRELRYMPVPDRRGTCTIM
jgi:hypothetical protein